MPHVSERGSTKIGQHRDLSDALTQIDKKNTWFSSAIRKGKKLMNTLAEWPMDDLDDVRTDGVVDDKDVTEFEDAYENYGLLSSYLQIHRRTPKVGLLAQEVSNVAGIGHRQTMAKAIAKKLLEIKRDIEATWLSDAQAQQGSGSTTPYKTRGLLKWTDRDHAVLPYDNRWATPVGSIFSGAALSTLDEKKFTDLMQARYDEVGEGTDLVFATGTTLRSHLSRMSVYTETETDLTVVRRFTSSKPEVLTRKVTVIETEFGTLKLRNSSFINLSGNPKSALSRMQGIGFDAANIMGRWAKSPSYRDLPDLGGGPRGLIESISMLQPGNPKDLIRVNPNGA